MLKKIKNISLSLMDKDTNFSIDEDNKGNFIIKASASFEVPDSVYEDPEEDINFDLVSIIYKDLLASSKLEEFDSLGLWITLDDETNLENSIERKILKEMEEMGLEVDAVFEFAKMTLIDES